MGVLRVERERVGPGVVAVGVQHELAAGVGGRGQGAGGDDVVQHVHVRVVLVRERVQRVHPGLYPLANLLVERAAQRVALEARHGHDARFVVVAQRGRILRQVGAAAHAQRVVLNVAVLKQQLLVVGAAAGGVVFPLIGGQKRGDGDGVEGRGAGPVGLQAVLVILLAVLQVEEAVSTFLAVVAAVGGLGRPGFAPPGGDEDDAVGPARPVDGRRGRILQHFHRRQVIGVQVVEAAVVGHPVHHQQRVVGARKGAVTADADNGGLARRGAVARHRDARRPALQGLGHVGHRHVVQRLLVHRRDGARYLAFLLHAVAHHLNLVQGLGFGGQPGVKLRRAAHRHFLLLVANRADDQSILAFGHGQGVHPRRVGGGAYRGAFHDDRDARQRLAGVRSDGARHRAAGLGPGFGRQQAAHQEGHGSEELCPPPYRPRRRV